MKTLTVIEDIRRRMQMRMDADEETEEAEGPKKFSGLSTRLPYALCKDLGIDTTGMTPRQAWEAIEGKGIDPKETFEKKIAEPSKKVDLKKPEKTETVKKGEYSSKVEKFKSTSDCIDFAHKTLGLRFYDLSNMNVDVANTVVSEVANFYDTFEGFKESRKLKAFKQYPKSTSCVAAYAPFTKEVLLRNVKRKDSLSKMKAQAEAQKKTGFWSTGDTEHAMRHEIGHAIGYWLANRGDEIGEKRYREIRKLRLKTKSELGIDKWNRYEKPEIVKKAGKVLSYYSLYSTHEFIAESVAEYMSGHPRETAKKVVDVLLRKDW